MHPDIHNRRSLHLCVDTQSPPDRLSMLDRHLLEAQNRIYTQDERVTELGRRGCSTMEAERLLDSMHAILQAMRESQRFLRQRCFNATGAVPHLALHNSKARETEDTASGNREKCAS